MLERHKKLLRPLVADLRKVLAGSADEHGNWHRGDLDRELERLGFGPDGSITPLDALLNPMREERRAYDVANIKLGGLKSEARITARAELIDRAAYTWINRLLALRAMEARALIEETLRNNPEYDGLSEALYVLRQTSPARTMGGDGGWWAVLEDACTTQAMALPGLFDLQDPNAALRPSTPALLACIRLVGSPRSGYSLEECDAAFADPDAIGWAYQFYQEAAKARVYAKLGAGGKAGTRAEIAAATQLFTEPYMVQWLLQNSLGRSYHELYPDSKLPESWPYYIKPEKLEGTPGASGLQTLSVLDPCCGSGHFLREAFDMLVAMYREQFPYFSAAQVADNILERHLHGIDLDPRAVQLATVTLFIRARELVRDERRQERLRGSGNYYPQIINLATTPSEIEPGALERHLRRHPSDRILKPILEGIFSSLEQADVLGSLLRPREYLDRAITALQGNYNIPLDLDPADAALRLSLIEEAKRNPDGLRAMLMERIAATFREEAGQVDDVPTALFGREAVEGVQLLQLLERKYAVVVTNPPYMGSKNMSEPLRKFVEQHYKSGKRDLYAAFILRCLELCKAKGRFGIITMQGWMFLRSFVELRAVKDENLPDARKKGIFTGLLRETTIEALAHLGPNAFEEISGEVVQAAMIVAKSQIPLDDHNLQAFRLVKLQSASEKAEVLRQIRKLGNNLFNLQQKQLLDIVDAVIVYYFPYSLLNLLSNSQTVRDYGYTSWSVSSSDNLRFLRLWWETPFFSNRWASHVKGGGYAKWRGLNSWSVEWRDFGIAIRSFIIERYPYLGTNYEIKVRPYLVGLPGWTFSSMAGKGLAVRLLSKEQITNAKSPAIFSLNNPLFIAGFLNSIFATFILRGLTPNLNVDEGYVASIPIVPKNSELLSGLVSLAVVLKAIIISDRIAEREFSNLQAAKLDYSKESLLHSTEGIINSIVAKIFDLSERNIQQIAEEIGTPAGWYPLITGYDSLPELLEELELPSLPEEVFTYLAKHRRISLEGRELARIKANLRALYEAGPGAKEVEQEEAEAAGEGEEGEEAVSGAHIPIPTETFLEELSVKLQIHPISIYWLLEELRAEGACCKPEEQRLLEDRLSVLVLRLLGHRWPRQLEAGEPVPAWADKDGIIPITHGTGESTLTGRLLGRLRAEDGELGAQKTEALLAELTGLNLEDWLRRQFFERHKRQFKYRPIAWHLASKPQTGGTTGKKKGGSRRPPAFECLLYYHACSGDILARLRTQYVEPLLAAERRKLEEARRAKNEAEAALAADKVQELEAFTAQLRQVEEEGFACADLDKLLEKEPLDRWCGDGYLAPTQAEFWQNERAWKVDLNDGVRVNIAPLQLAGLLTNDVLKAVDAKKAIADRARWRADERRWVREGKLPRCGWMPDDTPESQRWTDLAPQRAAEQAKLEQKRKAVAEKGQPPDAKSLA